MGNIYSNSYIYIGNLYSNSAPKHLYGRKCLRSFAPILSYCINNDKLPPPHIIK